MPGFGSGAVTDRISILGLDQVTDEEKFRQKFYQAREWYELNTEHLEALNWWNAGALVQRLSLRKSRFAEPGTPSDKIHCTFAYVYYNNTYYGQDGFNTIITEPGWEREVAELRTRCGTIDEKNFPRSDLNWYGECTDCNSFFLEDVRIGIRCSACIVRRPTFRRANWPFSYYDWEQATTDFEEWVDSSQRDGSPIWRVCD
jgi:hypothetical protein